MLKKILIGVGIFAALLIAVIATRPPEVHIERSAVINAPADMIFPYTADLRKFDEWSPWAELDPDVEKKLIGPATGVGSAYEWSGNEAVGTGKMTVKQYDPPKKVVMELEFMEPFQSTSDTTMMLVPVADGTKVTWSMDGSNDSFMEKAVGLFMDLDELIGGDYEKGLSKLKAVAENRAREVAAMEASRAE